MFNTTKDTKNNSWNFQNIPKWGGTSQLRTTVLQSQHSFPSLFLTPVKKSLSESSIYVSLSFPSINLHVWGSRKSFKDPESMNTFTDSWIYPTRTLLVVVPLSTTPLPPWRTALRSWNHSLPTCLSQVILFNLNEPEPNIPLVAVMGLGTDTWPMLVQSDLKEKHNPSVGVLSSPLPLVNDKVLLPAVILPP